jgi:hypothetical protein
MPANSDRVCGLIGLALTSAYLVYFMIWVLIVPLLEDQLSESQREWLQSLFPPREIAIAFIAAIGYCICLIPCLFLAYIMCREYWSYRRERRK